MSITKEVTATALGRGSLYLNARIAGVYTGEQAFGNAPEFSYDYKATKAEHYESQTAISQKDRSKIVREERGAKITVDHVSVQNIAYYLGGSIETVEQTASTVTDEEITVVPGRHYQIGQTPANPAGVRNISALTVKAVAGTITYVLGVDYEADLTLGRLRILSGGAIVAGKIQLGYEKPAAKWKRIKTGEANQIEGALRFISDNADGENRDYYFPSVKLTPSGSLPLIKDGTEFIKITFDVEILKPEGLESIYVDGRPE